MCCSYKDLRVLWRGRGGGGDRRRRRKIRENEQKRRGEWWEEGWEGKNGGHEKDGRRERGRIEKVGMERVEGYRGDYIGMRDWVWKCAHGRWMEVRLIASCRLHMC